MSLTKRFSQYLYHLFTFLSVLTIFRLVNEEKKFSNREIASALYYIGHSNHSY